MKKNEGPILVIEDDLEDQQFLKTAYQNLARTNEMICFEEGPSFIEFLEKTDQSPFVILCNLKLRKMTGFEIRDKIEAVPELKIKSIPFIFLTTDLRRESVQKAYTSTIQGYVLKGDTFPEMERSLSLVLDYWDLCIHPDEV